MKSVFVWVSMSRSRRAGLWAVVQLLVLQGINVVATSQPAVALTPPMGWNSWYALGKAAGWPSTNETVLRSTVDSLVATGLREAGYTFVVVDDSWENGHREKNGSLLADPVKFPSGMAALSNYARTAGLQLGLYTVPGNYTCAGERSGAEEGPRGSFGHTQQDVDLWVSGWGIGYLKDCVCNTTEKMRRTAYKEMAAALKATGRSVVYECDPFMDNPWLTLSSTCNLWAVSDDIADSFASWTAQVDRSYADGVTQHAGPGHWNSFDYLQIGNGGQTMIEYASQFAMYAMLAAPLFIGTDVRKISAASLEIYGAREIIAVNQDPLGLPPVRLWQEVGPETGAEAWVRPLNRADGDAAACAVLLLNRASKTVNVTVSWSQLAMIGPEWRCAQMGAVRDLRAQRSMGNLQSGVTVALEPHESAIFKVTMVQSECVLFA